ncbi:pleckstrin homology domain-containing family A member 5 isoform X12 [Rana temporaria]|uniref:pleckstrin homology domain-containing family A member 5 isoform X12 n=1 Tax=Rana temporaria TaxID=8407 RepID=UPI001AACAA07|nr:pleckstrin homology domain-containing family A member 5 isoform X12 [Rana temporaria]
MAADGSPDWVSALPWAWGYGITEEGRVFFINEEAQSTTWLHPVTGETTLTGHRRTPDLPTGWEEAYTFEGARYYINHNERKVTCKHPVTGLPSQDNCIFVVNDQSPSTMTSQETKDRAVSVTSDTSNCNAPTTTGNPASPISRSSRSSGKLHNFGKRSNSIKRNPNAPVTMRGWLYKKANSGMKLWKKRWFVLSDLCLFYYRDEKEEGVLGSILLPSFKISVVIPEDHINRSYAFKAAHPNMRTYYFCSDTSKEMELWMRAMIGAALVHSEPAKRENAVKQEHMATQEMNHVANHRLLIRPETNNNQRNKEITSKVEEKTTWEADKYGFQKEGQDRPLTKINSVKIQSCISDYDILATSTGHYKSVYINGPDNRVLDSQGHITETDSHQNHRPYLSHGEPDKIIQRTSSMQQLEQWIRTQRERGPEDDPTGVLSYQTLPRNMPSYRAQVVPRYPEGYKTLPRNLKTRPDSVCSTAGMGYDRTMVPGSATGDEKRRSIRDDTMWQLYEWQQRQFYNKQTTLRRHSSLTSPKTMVHISDQTLHSIPLSPSHGSISGYHTYSPHRAYRSEVSSPVQRGDLTMERRPKAQTSKLGLVPDRRSVPAGLALQPVSPQGLQGKTPEELTLLLIKLRRQQAELSSIREHTLTQLLHLKQACGPQMTQDECRPSAYKHRSEEADVDSKLSRLCEQDKVVQALEQKLQQLHKEKYTLEQALLSASQEIEMNTDNPAAVQNVVIQRDELQNGLLSTCREVSRATTELERAWRDYDKLEREVTTARNQLRERLERLGEVQTETAGIQRAQMQKEIWRIQDVMEGLSKHKQQRSAGASDSNLFSSGKSTSEGPDYRLYKSEPELTTVAEVDESNGDDKTDLTLDMEGTTNKGSHFPVGVVPPRTKSPPLESTTIASYVTLRKSRKPEAKLDRPRSAVEHLCVMENPRPRMTLEEQLERMRRHQAACLKEKKKGFAFLGSTEPSPSQSPAFSRENSIKLTQVRRKEENTVSETKDKEEAERENSTQSLHPEVIEAATGAEEPRVISDKEPLHSPTASSLSDAKDEVTEETATAGLVPEPQEQCLQVVTSVLTYTESEEKPRDQEHSGILFAYEFSADALRRHTSLEAGNLTTLPEPPTLPMTAKQPQLSEGSHFMCV